MSYILCYLRSAGSHVAAVEAGANTAEDFYLFRVQLTNGKSHIYEQIGDRFFRKDAGPWTVIPKSRNETLKKLEKFLFFSKNSLDNSHIFDKSHKVMTPCFV